jgi:hypothetical protein
MGGRMKSHELAHRVPPREEEGHGNSEHHAECIPQTPDHAVATWLALW